MIISKTENAYILADSSKFNQISNIKFAEKEDAVIITERLLEDLDYSSYGKIISISDPKNSLR